MNARDRRALMWGGGLVVAAVVYRLVLLPGLQTLSEARVAAAAAAERVELIGSRVERLDGLNRRLAERFGPAVGQALQTVDAVRVAFPPAVQKALGRAGAGVESVELQSARRMPKVDGVSLVGVRVDASCDPGALPAVLDALRTCPEFPVIVESAGITMAKSGDRGGWKLTLSLATPAISPPRAAAPGGGV